MGHNVGFIGLGVMGYPMAGHLAAAGHSVTVYNRTTNVAERWSSEHRGRHVATPYAAAQGADFVFACVGNDDDVRAVALGRGGAFEALSPGAVFVDHTTALANLARELHAAAAERGAGFLDAPVSGGQAGAEQGTLTCMLGGEEKVFEQVRPLLANYCRSASLLGAAGSGQLCKMVNQICIAGTLQGLAEALHFSQAVGLDGEQVVDVIGKGAAQSWQMDNRATTMLADKFDFGFAVDWMRKDLGIVLEQARTAGVSLPVAALVDQFYAQVQQQGGGRFDTSSLIVVLNRLRAGASD